MIASRMVLTASSLDSTETIPAFQAWAKSWGSGWQITTILSGLDKGRGSRANANSSRTITLGLETSGRSTRSTGHAQLRDSASRRAVAYRTSAIESCTLCIMDNSTPPPSSGLLLVDVTVERLV